MKAVRNRLDELGITYSILPSGELFLRREDGVPMYVRAYLNDQYDWTFKGSHNDTNHLDYRAPHKESLEELFAAIEQFRKASE